MKQTISALLSKETSLSKKEIENLIEIPPSQDLGDYAFPCFTLAKQFKKNPNQISEELAKKISSKDFEKIEAKGPYINFFISRKRLAKETIVKILKEKENYGRSKKGKEKTLVIDMSSPNIAKPFGIGHLRSTIIGNAIANISSFQGFKPVKLNYLGDWGTPFGKIIAGYKKFGDPKKLEKEPIKHLYEIYVRVSKSEEFSELGKEWFKKMEEGDKEALKLWKQFKELSIKEFNKIYSLLGIKFDVISGESFYNNKMEATIKELKARKLLKESEGAEIIDLNEYDLGVVLIKKSDGATLYATRDITAAIDRNKKYKADYLFYEVGSEQILYFKQLFKVLDLMGYKWAKNCRHIDHGLYLDNDGKKFATRKGKLVFMEEILDETKELAKKELKKRYKLNEKELEERALTIARTAIIYGDLKNFRSNNIIFDIQRFLEFEGHTGPYLLYTYARAKSILRKAKKQNKKSEIKEINEVEKSLLLSLNNFPEVVKQAHQELAPNLIANYAYELSQKFNEFYHSSPVIGSEQESFRLSLVGAFAQTLKNSLFLLGIPVLEEM